MKLILSIILIIISCSSQGDKVVESGYIEFKNAGPSDKPMTTILISTRDYPPQDFRKVILVDKTTFSFLYEYVDAQKKKYDSKVNLSEWYTFEVSTMGDNLIDSFYLPTQEKSNQFFKDLIAETERNNELQGIPELQKELKALLKRITIIK